MDSGLGTPSVTPRIGTDNTTQPVETFSTRLAREGLKLTRLRAAVLQINTGLLCNQHCRHCHLDAGPERKELMDAATCLEVAAFARRGAFETIDITGGAPELNPHLLSLLTNLVGLAPRIMLRTNLTALLEDDFSLLLRFCCEHRVVLVASLPSLHKGQLEAQRGLTTFERSVRVLRQLNAMGYGQPGSELQLHLVANPAGAFLPAPQAQAERRFREELRRKWGIAFHQLFAFANVPLGRFRQWLYASGNYAEYLQKLAAHFNPCAVDGLMCRTLVSVSWDGYLHDCDFNLAERLYWGGRKTHVSALGGAPPAGMAIAVGNHCYACTAGSGFT
jgi:radical SAM/Cys-rich protein